MNLSKSGAQFIHKWEELRLKAYQDGGGVWTIGYGHTKNVHEGLTITKKVAEKLFTEDVSDTVDQINRLVYAPLNQDQFDVLVSLVFNIGSTQFRNSTLLRTLNQRDYLGVPQQIMRWNIDNGKRVYGLLRRRDAESHKWINSLR